MIHFSFVPISVFHLSLPLSLCLTCIPFNSLLPRVPLYLRPHNLSHHLCPSCVSCHLPSSPGFPTCLHFTERSCLSFLTFPHHLFSLTSQVWEHPVALEEELVLTLKGPGGCDYLIPGPHPGAAPSHNTLHPLQAPGLCECPGHLGWVCGFWEDGTSPLCPKSCLTHHPFLCSGPGSAHSRLQAPGPLPALAASAPGGPREGE